MTRRRTVLSRLAALVALTIGLAAPSLPAHAQETGPVVFAAASLKNAFDEINDAWTAESGKTATISYAASSALAQQIESGAPADVFASADLAWMDYLAERDLIQPATRTELLGNDIVLVAPRDSAVSATEIGAGIPLRTMLAGGKLAMANVDSVPAGRYGKAALEKLGVWNDVSADVAQAENVRAALALVSRGEAPLGIVYKTDAAADPSVKIVGTFPDDSHEPIVYPVAVTKAATSADAAAFVEYLKTDAARALFEKQGFNVLSAR